MLRAKADRSDLDSTAVVGLAFGSPKPLAGTLRGVYLKDISCHCFNVIAARSVLVESFTCALPFTRLFFMTQCYIRTVAERVVLSSDTENHRAQLQQR